MQDTPIDLRVTQEGTEHGITRRLYLEGMRDKQRPRLEIFFEMLGEKDIPPPPVLDGFIFGIILRAMRLRQNVRVHGALSRDALLNVHEFQEAWALWKPEVYSKVRILPSDVLDSLAPATPSESLAAFSGGVDSVFTALRHRTKQLGNASYPLNDAVIMVHGFDVPLDAPEHLAVLQDRTKPLLDELDLRLITIRTNLKAATRQDWGDSFMAQLACCLHNYAHKYRYGLAGSSEPYNALILPWGSSPATDHLLSGAAMRLVHDGAGYSRTAKVAYLAKHETAIRVLKVCWEGKETFKNCGACEKCIRTQLNFLAAGMSHAPCFDAPFDTAKISSIALRNDVQCAELMSIYKYAAAEGRDEPWMHLLKARLDAYRPSGPFQRLAKTYGARLSRITRRANKLVSGGIQAAQKNGSQASS